MQAFLCNVRGQLYFDLFVSTVYSTHRIRANVWNFDSGKQQFLLSLVPCSEDPGMLVRIYVCPRRLDLLILNSHSRECDWPI